MFKRTIQTSAFALLALSGFATAQDMLLPQEGAEMNRLHMRFRWEPAANVNSTYFLEVAVDDGSTNPFGNGLAVGTSVSNAVPQTIVTSGLDWGTDYVARVTWNETNPTPIRKTTPFRRFSTKSIVIDNTDINALPEIGLIPVPPGGGALQPGVTLFTISRRDGMANNDQGHVLAVDNDGQVVYHTQIFGQEAGVGDIRQMPNGRLLGIRNIGSAAGTGCSSAIVLTLNGKKTFETNTAYCFDDPVPVDHNGSDLARGPHHEVFAMPENGPNGANFLIDYFDNRTIASYTDPFDGVTYTDMNWRGDRAVEVDRHTQEVVWELSTFDYMDMDDHLPQGHPSNAGGPGNNWNHTNSISYDPFFNRVIFSNRRQSRVVGVNYDTKQVEFNLGDNSVLGIDINQPNVLGPWPSGVTILGDNFFSWQHAPQALPNGNIMIYNNGNFTDPYDPLDLLANRLTTAVEIEFDNPAAPTSASIVWSYDVVEEDLVTPAFERFVGDADRLANGNTLIANGFNSNIQEVDPSGQLVWMLDTGPTVVFGPPTGEAGSIVYRAERIDALVVDTPSDTDGDFDVDLLDLAQLQVEFGNASPAWPATLSDHDGDSDIDADDLERFNYWMTGHAFTRKP